MARRANASRSEEKLPIPEEILNATEARLRQSDSGLETREIPTERLLQANSSEAVAARLQRMKIPEATAKTIADRMQGATPAFEMLDADPAVRLREEVAEDTLLGLERILGNNELMSVRFLNLGSIVARTVGRVVIRSSRGITRGYGTGFMVSPRLVLTNNHVLPNTERAKHSRLQFNYQEGLRLDSLDDETTFTLEPDLFFVTDKSLDFTLVAVGDVLDGDGSLGDFGWLNLSEEEGEILIGEKVNIVQHPNGERKQLALRENRITALPENRFLQYRTDTCPGSSGSPVFNDHWEVVGLHHSGVPRRDSQKRILARDGSLWKPSMGEHRVDWIANEGIRIAAILAFVRNRRLDNETQRSLRRGLLEGDEAPVIRHERRREAREESRSEQTIPVPQATGEMVWTIPLQVSVRMGQAQIHLGTGQMVSDSMSGDGGRRAEEPFEEEAVSIDPDYRNRQGYDPEFLGSNSHRVDLPRLSDAQLRHVARIRGSDAGDNYVLRYHHYSVVMNGTRRLAYLTAVNIDGRIARRVRRERDKWFFDPRISREQQAGNEVYKRNPLDRGHLVRRLDPAWGESQQIAKVANDDTFHWTNCSPQHEDFNRNDTTWAGLEDYVLDNAIAKNFQVSVFTGPVLAGDDEQYRGIQLPRQFWKVVVLVKDNGDLSATAYLLSQERLLRRISLEGFQYGAYRNFQVKVQKVEELTGLAFGLSSHDPLERLESFGTESLPAQQVDQYEELIF